MEPPPIPLIKLKNDGKPEKYCVKIKIAYKYDVRKVGSLLI